MDQAFHIQPVIQPRGRPVSALPFLHRPVVPQRGVVSEVAVVAPVAAAAVAVLAPADKSIAKKRGRKPHTPEQQAESAKRAQLKAQSKKTRLNPIEEDDD